MDETLSDEQKDELIAILRNNDLVWFNVSNGGGKCSVGTAQLQVSGRPIRAKLRPMSWASAPVFVKKPDGKWRMAIDYRQVNQLTIPDAYPLPYLWDVVSHAAGRAYVAVIDLKSGFWNIPLTKESRAPTAFITPFGLYEWTVLPFGIDDIIPAGDDWPTFAQAFRETFEALSKAGLQVNMDKLQINGRRAKVVGHLVSPEGVTADPSKVAREPRSYGDPTDRVNEDRRSLEVGPLRRVKSSRNFILETDASDQGAGAVLKQEQDGVEEVLEFASAKFSHFAHYLRGAEVEVRTDHASLQWMASASAISVVLPTR
eukprot:GHVS01027621.1.p1 GENE.GHVS01027621.1~~GHVS01027621.1.p1  ORF type:complete len:315 (+),score=24.36 GHVS01027621.1:1111-2055(+)